MADAVRVGVIGVGALGRHHARILGDTPDAVLAAVVDVNATRAAEIAAQHGAHAHLTDASALVGKVDAVTIASPTEAHFPLAAMLIDAGIHVLVEKPMTTTLAQADDLIARAAARGVVLAVGHTERFNPAVDAARQFLSRPRFIEVHRLGTFPDRSLDIDVVFDLMIHDLDVLLSVVDEDVVGVEAVGVPDRRTSPASIGTCSVAPEAAAVTSNVSMRTNVPRCPCRRVRVSAASMPSPIRSRLCASSRSCADVSGVPAAMFSASVSMSTPAIPIIPASSDR